MGTADFIISELYPERFAGLGKAFHRYIYQYIAPIEY